MTTPAQDDFSLRSMLDTTLKDFGVQAEKAPTTTPEPPEVDIKQLPIDRRTQALLAFGALLIVAVIGYFWGARQPVAPPVARPTAIPTVLATEAPTVAPATPVRLLAAFAAPDGLTLGTIEATRPITPVAHFGSAWIQADVEGSGRIWIRAADLPGVALTGPDLAPPTPAPRPTARPVVAPVSAPASAPATCTQDTAPFIVRRRVLLGSLPIGEVSGWSCVSAAEAEAAANRHEAEVRQSYAKTSEAR